MGTHVLAGPLGDSARWMSAGAHVTALWDRGLSMGENGDGIRGELEEGDVSDVHALALRRSARRSDPFPD